MRGLVEADLGGTRDMGSDRIGNHRGLPAALRLVTGGEFRRHATQALHVDAARPGDVVEGEVDRREVHLAGEALVPCGGCVRRIDDLLGDRLAFGLIGGKRLVHIVMAGQRSNERNRIFHGEARSGTDGKVRSVDGITEKDMAARNPLVAPKTRELPPHRLVGDERSTLQRLGKNAFAEPGALFFAHPSKAIGLEGRLIAFDDERAAVRLEAIMVGVERAFVGLHEGLRERVEGTLRAEPGEVIAEMVEMDAETCFVGASHQRIQPVRADDQIRIQIVQRLDMLRKADFNAESLGALAQDFDQLKTADCRETDAIQDHLTGGQVERHIAPALHGRRHQIMRFRIVGLQKIQRLIGENDPEAEGRALGILLRHAEANVRHHAPQQDRRIETGRTATQYLD